MMLTDVMVVGGSGFIGRRLLKTQPGWLNVDLANNQDFHDFHEHEALRNADAIVLLAAELGNTLGDYYSNLRIYEGLVHALMSREEQPFVLYVSSAAVYQSVWGFANTEDEMPRPGTLYGKSKLLGEQVVTDVCQNYAILRPSNVYGDGDGHGVIDLFKLGGTEIHGNGEQVRDYIYVDKVVQAINRVIASPDRYRGGVYNISGGSGQTVNEVFAKYGRRVDPRYAAPRDFDVEYSVLDNTLAKEAGLL